VLQSVALCDRLTFTPRPGPLVLTAHEPGLAVDGTNLIHRAAAVLWRALGRSGDPEGARIALVKAIPLAAGLGGGSADAAATLVGLNRVWRAGLSLPALSTLAAQLGADVPFFLVGGAAVGAGRGEELYPVEDSPRLSVLIIKPAFGVSAADAYRWLDQDRTTSTVVSEAMPSDRLDLRWPTGAVAVVNDLQAPVCRRHPEVAVILDECRRAGALAAAMTGSGSAVFGVFPADRVRPAERRLRRVGRLVIATRLCRRREAAGRLGLL
jgi:4-diphosphocytidyl-2-C-methyl-D-erythritol kinase